MFILKFILCILTGFLVADILYRCKIKYLSWQWLALGLPAMFVLVQLIHKILPLE